MKKIGKIEGMVEGKKWNRSLENKIGVGKGIDKGLKKKRLVIKKIMGNEEDIGKEEGVLNIM